MAVSHWFHLNTYVSLAIIVAMLAAAIVFSLQRTKRQAARPPSRNDEHVPVRAVTFGK